MHAIVPTLASVGVFPPYWQHHARDVTDSLRDLPLSENPVLVAHSGAGPLLPAVRTDARRKVAGYIFVDAGLPGPDGASRLDLMDAATVANFLRACGSDGFLPVWTELAGATGEKLTELVPDPHLRKRFIAELRPLPLAVYAEPLPVFSGWPDAPCGYIRFSATYESEAIRSRQNGWRVIDLPGGHFHTLVEPGAVATTLVHLMRDMEI